MKKSILSAVFLICFSLIAQTQNPWLPLKVGNKWQMIRTIVSSGRGIYSSSIELQYRTIEKDTIINNIIYYDYDNQWVRYTNDDKVYIWGNNSDNLFMDFNKHSGDTIDSYYGGRVSQLQVIEGVFDTF